MIVIGDGIIGYSCAWQLSLQGYQTTLIGDANSTASQHAAGILFPNHLAMIDNPDKMALMKVALESWPVWAQALEDDSYQLKGMLQAFTESKREQMHDWAATIQGSGWEKEILAPGQMQERLPHIHVGPEVVDGFWVPEVYAVDPQHHLELLQKAFLDHQGKVFNTKTHVQDIVMDGGRSVGVQWPDGEVLIADYVVVATGWSDYSWLPESARPKLEAHMGEHIIVQVEEDWPSQPILVFPGSTAVTRSNNRMWVGVTVRAGDELDQPTVGGDLSILQHASALMPDLADCRVLDTGAGIRPVSCDGIPWVGPTPIPGLLLATGHGRSGILQAPIAAKAIVDYIEQGEMPEWSALTDPRLRQK